MEGRTHESVHDTFVAPNSYRTYRKIFDRVLSPLPAGKLRVALPTGEEFVYGMKASGPEATIKVLNPAFFKKCILYGEANNEAGARRNISEHYDLGNDFYKLFLDPSMTYSCAYFSSSDQSLEAAQTEKYDRLCQKLKLTPTDHVLEIGGGWGGFAVHAARNYGCRVTSITISKEQWKYAKDRAAAEDLSNQIDFQLTDYRNVTGKFDKIVSIEMIEAVGHEYFKSFFKKCHGYESHRKNVTWMQKHIFPGGLLPSIGVMNKAINETGDLQLHDLEDMAPHYARTLATWRENFNHKLESVLALGFNEKRIAKPFFARAISR
jgi:cyclopropane-fatty-acyl-phospholipid synthase